MSTRPLLATTAEISADESPAILVRAPAKLNLSLAVLARRDDGFHEIESLIAPVTLHDSLRVRASQRPGIRLHVRFGGRLATPAGAALAHDVPTDASNLVVRAAQALAVEAGVAGSADAACVPGLDVELVKRIPSGSGLGGGSSDAAAVLVAAAKAWGLDMPPDRLAAIGARIGSDVPVFFAGGAALAGGRGERIEPVPGIPPLHAVIARPLAGLSTAAVYARCTPEPGRRGAARQLAEALVAGRFQAAATLMHNSLEQPARDSCAEVARLLDHFSRAGAVHPLLTGSGSACFAVLRTALEARRVAGRLEMAGWPGVFVVRLATPGHGRPLGRG
ncbi:MAG: 4-(cytidine 5'-diphospho)-2-C-methyl-D-erythritol kinase [Planctomycetia bacterium]